MSAGSNSPKAILQITKFIGKCDVILYTGLETQHLYEGNIKCKSGVRNENIVCSEFTQSAKLAAPSPSNSTSKTGEIQSIPQPGYGANDRGSTPGRGTIASITTVLCLTAYTKGTRNYFSVGARNWSPPSFAKVTNTSIIPLNKYYLDGHHTSECYRVLHDMPICRHSIFSNGIAEVFTETRSVCS